MPSTKTALRQYAAAAYRAYIACGHTVTQCKPGQSGIAKTKAAE